MKLRSGKRYISEEYIVNIDFDEASRQWRKNKINRGNGIFLINSLTTFSNHIGCKI